MMRVTSLLGRFKHYLAIGAVFSLIYSPCDAFPENKLNEFQVIEYVVVMGDDSRYKKIDDFLYKKAREYSRQNKEFEFGDEMFLESKYDNADRSFDIIRLDENNYLIKLTLDNDEIRKSGCLFLINPAKPDWAPLQLESRGDKSLIKPYSFIPDWMNYSTPLLSAYRWSGRYDGESFLDVYVFKEGTFKLIMSEETAVDEKKAEGINLEDETTDIEEYLKTTVYYIDHDIAQLYAKFAPKEDEGLEKSDNWEKIFFVKPSKTYFYEQPNEKTKQTSYIVKGDAVYISETREYWALANYLDPKSTQVTTGWVKKNDLANLWGSWTDHVCAR